MSTGLPIMRWADSNGQEMDEIEKHLSSCDSCCLAVRDQPDDLLIAKLRGCGAAMVAAWETEGNCVGKEPSGFEVPSSFIVGPEAAAALNDQPTVAGPDTDPPAPSRGSPMSSPTIRATGSSPRSAPAAWGPSTAPSIA